MKPRDIRAYAAAMRLFGLGWLVVSSIVLGTVVGVWLDGRTGLNPLFTLLGLGLGLTVAFWGLYKMVAPLLNKPGSGKG